MMIADAQWQPLRDEFKRWRNAGLTATLWWRDDDAIQPTTALDRMIELAETFNVPLGLAVIPASAHPALATQLSQAPMVDVLQHGFVHKNHAAAGERAAEFGAQRSVDVRLAEIADGWRRLAEFPRRTPIFVPPWNRYEPDIAPGLAELRFSAVSAFAVARRLPAGLVECNCHVDIISWRTTRGFAGTTKTMSRLVEHLQERRTGSVRVGCATGLLTHHLAHDEECWQFIEQLFARLAEEPAVRWLRPADAVSAMGAQ